ncbi:MAG: hypothetical protein R3E90_06680 [Marinicella sp.]
MSKFFTILLLLFSSYINSKSWNHLLAQKEGLQFSPDFPTIESPVLIDNKLVFKGLSYQHFGLWSYDTQTNELLTLIPSKANNSIRNLTNTGSEVYFLYRETEYGHDTIWKTDGTLSGTGELNNEHVFIGGNPNQPSMVFEDNVLLARGSNGVILEFSNNQMISHDVGLYDVFLNRLCVFGPQNFVTFDYYDEKRVVHITESGISELSTILPEGFVINHMVNIDNDCYIHITEGFDYNAPFDILKVSPSGETKLFSDNENLQKIYQIFKHNNQKYAFRKNLDEENSSSILTLSAENQIENVLFTLSNGSFNEIISTKGQLHVRFDESLTGEYKHYYMGSDNSFLPLRSDRYLKLPNHYPSLNSDTLILTEEELPGKIEINSINSDGQQVTVSSQGFDFINAISSEFSDNVFYLLRDRETGIKSIYSLSDQPYIGAPSSGIWHDPELKNQGLFIRQGNRHFGAPYIFATMYTFHNGQPFWVAGNTDYSPGQSSIQIDLFDFQGSNFFELFEEPARNEFGTITITPSGCDSMHIQVAHDGLTHDFNFRRINNTTYKKYCLQN